MSSLQEVEAFWEKVCFDPNFQPEGRYQTYRELVFEGMLDVLQSVCPVARGILSDEEWKEILWNFLQNSPPKSVVIRELPYEASQYLKSQEHPFFEKYPWLGELMEYEYLEVQVRLAPEDEAKTPEGQLRLNPAYALGEYTWPVHFISEDRFDPKDLPRSDFYLFLWREPKELEVKFMEVNPLVAELIRQLRKGPQEPEKLLLAVAQKMGIEVSEEYLSEGKGLLTNFIGEGILLP